MDNKNGDFYQKNFAPQNAVSALVEQTKLKQKEQAELNKQPRPEYWWKVSQPSAAQSNVDTLIKKYQEGQQDR